MQRYDFAVYHDGAVMEHSASGEWVRYEDVQKRIAELEKQLQRVMADKPNPPLCPGTEEEFSAYELRDGSWYVDYDVVEGECDCCRVTMDSGNAAHRRFLARYQAIAWQDMAQRICDDGMECDSEDTYIEFHTARRNAEAWRKWERGE